MHGRVCISAMSTPKENSFVINRSFELLLHTPAYLSNVLRREGTRSNHVIDHILGYHFSMYSIPRDAVILPIRH